MRTKYEGNKSNIRVHKLVTQNFIESQGWKGPTRSSSPAVLPLPLLPQATKPYLIAPHPDAS